MLPLVQVELVCSQCDGFALCRAALVGSVARTERQDRDTIARLLLSSIDITIPPGSRLDGVDTFTCQYCVAEGK